jgi:hypothetical protein
MNLFVFVFIIRLNRQIVMRLHAEGLVAPSLTKINGEHGTAQHSTAQHNTSQHTAQYSIAHHNSAEHSTAYNIA